MTAAPGLRPGIVSVGETPALRHPDASCSTAGLMAQAVGEALRRAGLAAAQVDGLGVASFTLRPDRAIDLAWQLGLRLNWCMQDELGGASAINLLRQAWLALQAGQAQTIVLVSGDHFTGADFAQLVRGYNRSAQETLSPLGCYFFTEVVRSQSNLYRDLDNVLEPFNKQMATRKSQHAAALRRKHKNHSRKR